MSASGSVKAGQAIWPKRFVLTFQNGAAKGRQLAVFDNMGSKVDGCKVSDLTIPDSATIRSDVAVDLRLRTISRPVKGLTA
jgi:hypothetical protein